MGRTVLGFKPLSIFLSPNMPLKGFEPVSLSHLLDMPATLPVTTRVLIGRVASMHSKCDKDTGSNPINDMLGERNMDRGSNTSTVLPTENAKSILESTLLTPNCHNRQGERGWNINLQNQCPENITFARHAGHTLPVTTRVVTSRVAGMHSSKGGGYGT